MPRHIIRRWMPDPHKIINHKGLRWLGSLIDDPNLFHLTRHSVSLAFLVGIFMAFIPLPGQMLAAALFALWLRCNLPISVGLVWITNPLTIPPMFYGTYLLGTLLLGVEPIQFTIEMDWQWFKTEGAKIWKPLIVGSLSCAVLLGAGSYFAVQLFWRWHVIRNWERRKQARQAHR